MKLPNGLEWSTVKNLLDGEWLNTERLPKPNEQSIVTDSREVSPGCGFLAYAGVSQDGHSYIPGAVAAGAQFLITEQVEAVPAGIPALLVPDGRVALSRLAAFCYGAPTEKLKTFGITGTNGKTTSLWLLSEALTRLGERVLRIGTLGIQFEGEVLSKGETTTPTSEEIHRAAEKALTLGATACVMEVSSHALKQHRADDVAFDGVLFTNLTPDHLDYHPDEEDYFQAKKRLFELGAAQEIPLVCGIFDAFGKRLSSWSKEYSKRAISFGDTEEASFCLTDLSMTAIGLSLTVHGEGKELLLQSPLIGEYNAHNLLGVFALLCSSGYAPEIVRDTLQAIEPPPGRMERFEYGGATIFVDYAHAPDALSNALQALQPITKGDLWVLFGCGGDRDPRRRVGMGNAAKEYADKIIVTSDNPRSEPPMKIIEDILETGLQAELVEVDRRLAIKKAVHLLQPGDILLVAGKGHEDYQIINGVTSFFSDQLEVEKAIAEMTGARCGL